MRFRHWWKGVCHFLFSRLLVCFGSSFVIGGQGSKLYHDSSVLIVCAVCYGQIELCVWFVTHSGLFALECVALSFGAWICCNPSGCVLMHIYIVVVLVRMH